MNDSEEKRRQKSVEIVMSLRALLLSLPSAFLTGLILKKRRAKR